ncbi:MAG TPA: hypothetical protein VGQ94_04035 [Terriglobales bacterium]|nr:hypothetical protein [Terriglobales bacterium]
MKGLVLMAKVASRLGPKPTSALTIGVLLVALAGQVPRFLLHHEIHQGQPRLAQQMTDSLLQHANHLGHRKEHLDVGVFVHWPAGGTAAPLVAARFGIVSS